tara:strand:+ start:75 stop:1382 length:1308 start_codon:yes stop_codon:yes gene_type:complete
MPGHHGGPSISSGSKTKTKTKTKKSSTPSGAVGFTPPSSAPSGPEIATTTANVIKKLENRKKERAKKLREELDNIVDKKGTEGFETTPGIVAIPTMGKRTGKFKDIEDKLRRGEKLTGAEQVIADFYLSSAVNPYQAQIQKFKERPGGLEVFKQKFPNPLVKVARGIGDFFREGTALGKILASLKPSDKKKAEIIVDESRRKPYEVPEGIMNYEDKILRDLRMKNRAPIVPGLTLNTAGMDEGIMAGAEPFSQSILEKKKFIENYTGQKVGKLTIPQINRAYDQIMKNIKEGIANSPEAPSLSNMMGSGDFTNFQPPSTEEQVVDEATGTENIFDLGSGMLSGSTSETDYMSEPTYSIPEVLDYNRPDQLRKQIDINTEDADLFTNNAFMGAPGFPAGGVESNLPEQKNMGGYMGMSTFDKLKMIAQGMADDRSK